jgi:hypothetical protein
MVMLLGDTNRLTIRGKMITKALLARRAGSYIFHFITQNPCSDMQPTEPEGEYSALRERSSLAIAASASDRLHRTDSLSRASSR